VTAPQLEAGDGFRVQASLDGQRPADDLVAALAALLVDGRTEALRTAANDAACSICGDRYPTGHLLAPTGPARVAVCPACVFDGDLLHTGSTAALAGQLDWLLATNLAAPAGWSAVAALLATAARPGLGRRLQAQWRRSGVVTPPSWWWSSPGDIWIWLPPASNRPHPLERFGPGAGLAAIARAVDSALPHLRQQVRDRLREARVEGGVEEPADGFAEAIWPAVLAYVVAFTTQAAERPTHRAPLAQVGDSFATFADHLGQLGSSLDDLDVELTLSAGLEVVGDALGRAG
jgi:hypothetical protein